MTVVDDVKSRTDIVELIGARVPLKKAGRTFKANCPFHTERTPSFVVFPERGTWRCFGACGTGGDVFSFLERADNLTFSEALSRLAEQAGVAMPNTRKQTETEQRETDALYTALQNAADYFHRILSLSPAGETARRYLQDRGIDEQTVSDFQLGLAPHGWEILKSHLSDLGHSEAQMLAAGLVIEREGEDGSSYDRFRGRLMFPVRDTKGRVIGFGARALDDSQPKYLNSPQTALFDKGAALYAIDRAQEAIRSEGEIVLVEGYMDVLQAHQRGFRNVAAIMGTALTERQVTLARGLTRRYALALDPDAAGEAATRRNIVDAWDIFRQEVVRVRGGVTSLGIRRELPSLRVIALPPNRDPDDVIRNDPDEWRRRVEEATPILDYLIQWEARTPEAVTPEGRREAVSRIFPLITALDNPFEQQAAFAQLAAALKIDESKLEAAVGRPERRLQRGRAVVGNSGIAAPGGSAADIGGRALEDERGDVVEEHLLALCLSNEHDVSEAWQRLNLPDLTEDHFWDPVNRDLWRVLTTGSHVEQAEAIVSNHARQLQSALPMKLDRRGLGRALGDLVRRMLERQLKRQDEEDALAVASLTNEDGDAGEALRAMTEETRRRFTERIEQLRAVQTGRWNRDSRQTDGEYSG